MNPQGHRRRPSSEHSLSKRRWPTYLTYGQLGLVTSIPLVPLGVYLPVFYAEDMGLGYFVVGVSLFLARLLDVVSDPVAGYLTDRYSIGEGGRNKWLVAGALCAGLGLLMLAVPQSNSALYLGFWSAVLYVGWTFVMVPYLAIGGDLTRSYKESTYFSGAREAFSLGGILLAVAIPVAVPSFTFSSLPWLVVPIGVLSVGLFLFGLPQRSSKEAPKRTQTATWAELLENPLVKWLLAGWFLTAAASAVAAAMFPLFIATVLGGGAEAKGISLFAYFAAAILAMPFWSGAGKNRSKQGVMVRGMALLCGVFLPAVFLGPADTILFYGICLLAGAALAAELVLGPALMTDIALVYRLRNGQDATAMHFSLWSMISKLAFAFAVLLAFGLVSIAQSAFTETDPSYARSIAWIYAGLPVVLKLASIVCLKKLPFGDVERDLIEQEFRRN